MTTFADITRVADAHHADALDLVRRRRAIPADPTATAAAIAKASGVLARYTDQITTGFGMRQGHWSEPAQSCGNLLRRATALASDAGPSPAHDDSPVICRLRAGAEALGCGLDLLVSHTLGTPAGPNAVVLASDSAGRYLLAMVGRHAATLADIASYASNGSAIQRAGALLGQAAESAPKSGDVGLLPIKAITLRTKPARIPPLVGEDRSRVLAGIAASTQRIIEADDDGSLTTWRYAAAGAGIGHHLGELILRQLATAPNPGQLAGAANRLSEAAASWRQITSALSSRFAGDHPPSSDLAQDIGDLVARLGRLVYADPSWLPNRRSASTALNPRAVLAPNPQSATSIALVVLNAVDAFRIVADRHHALIAKAVPPPTILLGHYQQARQRGVAATALLGRVVLELNGVRPRAAVASHTALILGRAHRSSALAATGFPLAVTDSLQTPVLQAAAAAPEPAARTSRTRSA